MTSEMDKLAIKISVGDKYFRNAMAILIKIPLVVSERTTAVHEITIKVKPNDVLIAV